MTVQVIVSGDMQEIHKLSRAIKELGNADIHIERAESAENHNLFPRLGISPEESLALVIVGNLVASLSHDLIRKAVIELLEKCGLHKTLRVDSISNREDAGNRKARAKPRVAPPKPRRTKATSAKMKAKRKK